MGQKMLNVSKNGKRTLGVKRWVSGVAEEPEKGGHQSGTYTRIIPLTYECSPRHGLLFTYMLMISVINFCIE